MSDLSLLAAAFAQLTAADSPNPNQPEPSAIAGRSSQAKHQAVQPLALSLHRASVDIYRAEFSRTVSPSAANARTPKSSVASPHAASPSAALTPAIRVIPEASAQPTPAIRISQPKAFETRIIASPGRLNLADTLPHLLPSASPLSLRPLLTRQGGSIAAVPQKIRPIVLKLHEASIETYASTLASAPLPGQHRIAQSPRARPAPRLQMPPVSQSPTLTATVSLSPAALALGMAQAAGAAQSLADGGMANAVAQQPSAERGLDTRDRQNAKTLQADSLLAGPPVVAAPISTNQRSENRPLAEAQPQPPSAAQAAIALDRRVRRELEKEAVAVSQAQRQSAANSPLWASPDATLASGSGTVPAASVQTVSARTRSSQAVPSPAVLSQAVSTQTAPTQAVRLSPEAVARANAAQGAETPVPEPSFAIAPDRKQAIAVAPLATRSVARPNLSPLQLPAPGGPRSGPQLYQQRLAALKQGRLYSRLPIDSFKSIWQGVRHKPSYGQWKRLLAAEARAAGRGQGNNRLSIVLGDSLSLWLPMQQLPSSQLWLNQGISGDTTAGILQRLEPLKDTRPSNIYVMAGVNDLKNGATDDQVAGNLQQIMRHLRRQHPQAQIHVQSILPASIGLPPGRIQRLNYRLAHLAQAEQVAFLDIYPQFAAPNGQMIAQLTTDGIHLSPQGYALWQSILRRLAEPWAFANRSRDLDLGRS